MHPVYFTGYNLSKLIARTLFRFKAVGAEKIPKEGPLILAMNHQSFLDPPLAGICCDRDIFFLARRSLFKWPILGPLFPAMNVIPVERDRPDIAALKSVVKVIRAGHGAVIFPEGTRSLDGSLRKARPGLGFVIAKTKAPVVPMRVFGAFDAFPKNSKLPRLYPITVVVGDPCVFPEEALAGDPRAVYQALSDAVMERIASIELPEDLRGRQKAAIEVSHEPPTR
jgi:1-acyl-sn-glycerol-3-phosphate acyltransferase